MVNSGRGMERQRMFFVMFIFYMLVLITELEGDVAIL